MILAEPELRNALRDVPVTSVEGPFHRAVQARWLYAVASAGRVPNILSGVFAFRAGGRFNPPESFPATYVACDPLTAMAEAEAAFVRSGVITKVAPSRPYTVVPIDGTVHDVLDLTSSSVQDLLTATVTELIAPWRPYQLRKEEAPTQRLGRCAYESRRIQGILAPSNKRPGGMCLVAFPERLRSPSNLQVVDEERFLAEELP